MVSTMCFVIVASNLKLVAKRSNMTNGVSPLLPCCGVAMGRPPICNMMVNYERLKKLFCTPLFCTHITPEHSMIPQHHQQRVTTSALITPIQNASKSKKTHNDISQNTTATQTQQMVTTNICSQDI